MNQNHVKLASDEFNGYSLVLIVTSHHFPKSPLTNGTAEFEEARIQLPLVTDHQQLVGVINLTCNQKKYYLTPAK